MFKKNVKNSETIPILTQEDDKQRTIKYGATLTKINEGNTPVNNNNPDTIINCIYPKAVIFVLCSKFFESFSANGVRTILALYLRDSLHFTEETATSILHVFNFFGQFCPILGAVLADSYIGNVKTILCFFILYAIGWIGMITMTYPQDLLPIVILVFISLTFISIGNGSIRACITSLGASQFKLPEQNEMLDRYFSHYYFVYTMGILLSKIVPPSVRAKTHCFGQSDCYLAVFGVLGAMFMASWVVFLSGIKIYKKEYETSSDGNILFQVIKCIWCAVTRKFKHNRSNENVKWITYAIGSNNDNDGPFTESFVNDVSAFLKVLKLFIPLPIYWSLLAQQDSSWTYQATQLNTNIFGLRIEADQAKAIGPILLLILIPLWNQLISPCLKYFNINLTPLKSVAIGCLCAIFAFICAGILQLSIENNNLLNSSNNNNNNNNNSNSSISILWQIPQFFLLMMGEILLSIPGLHFCFTQAPASMKSVLTAAWFINNAIGNLIVVVLTEIQPIKRQSMEFFMYSGLMFIGMVSFSFLAMNSEFSDTNQSVTEQTDNNDNENNIDNDNNNCEKIQNFNEPSSIIVIKGTTNLCNYSNSDDMLDTKIHRIDLN